MLSLEEYEKYKENHQQEKVYDIQSLLSVGETVQYQEQQSNMDRAFNLGKSLYNGFMSVPRGVLRGVQWLRDMNEAQLNEDHPERQQMDEGARQLLDNMADASMLQPYDVKAETGAGQFVYDLAQGAGQLGGQLAVGLATGGYGTLPAMALQIGGEEYKELRDQGVDVSTAGKAAAINAAVQTPLEYIGFSKITKAFPANSLFKQRLRMAAENVLTEGVTEFLQEYPEQASKLWALNADKSPEEIRQIIKDNIGNMTADALYSGVIGGFLGGGAGALHMALDQNITRAMQREVHSMRMDEEMNRIAQIKESKINPPYAAAVINGNTQDTAVYVDGEALQGYAQEQGAEKVAEALGVTVEDIQTAAANNDTVDVKLGNFEATAASFDGFFEAVKDDTAFEDGGYTVKKDKHEQEMARKYQEQENEIRVEKDRIAGEMKAAGVNNQTIVNALALATARALNTDDPVGLLRKLRFQAGTAAGQNNYHQFAGENAETADTIKLSEAQRMEESGATPADIFKSTGWLKGKDGRWRFEIQDHVEDIDFSGVEKFGELPLARVYYNEALFDAYPFLRQVKVSLTNLADEEYGRADGRLNVIALNRKHLQEDEMPFTLIHELQHFIQDKEGFAPGGDPRTVRAKIMKEMDRLTMLADWNDADMKKIEALQKRVEETGDMENGDTDQFFDAMKELAEFEKSLPKDKQEKIRGSFFRIRSMQKAIDTKSDYDLYERLGGEQEAREAADRAESGAYDTMPTPHKYDALIVFDGAEMPYSKKAPETTSEIIKEADAFYDGYIEQHPDVAEDEKVSALLKDAFQMTLDFGEDPATDIIVEGQISLFDENEPETKPKKKRAADKEAKRGKILGLGITRQLVNEGVVSLVGKKVRSTRDLAEIAQVLRHPGYEKFHVVYVDKNNKVVHHSTISSRLPGQTSVVANGEDWSAAWQRIFEDRDIHHADKFYFIHNHPSGDPSPSSADMSLTKHFIEGDKRYSKDYAPMYKRGFAGHIIIDHNKYSVIDRNGKVRAERIEKDKAPSYDVPEIPHDALYKGDEGLENATAAEVEARINENQARRINHPDDLEAIINLTASDAETTAFFLTQRHTIRAVQKIHDDFGKLSKAGMLRYLRYCARATFGAKCAIATSNYEVFEKIRDIIQGTPEEGILDVFYMKNGRPVGRVDTDSARHDMEHETWLGRPLGKTGARLLETNESYAQGQKGGYNPETNVITLFQGADASTVIHETWHFFIEQMWNSVQDGSASAQTMKDFDALLNYAGMTRDQWAAADVEGRRAAHERLAEAGETYIMEGKSPSYELRRVFRNFARWLRNVYQTIQRNENAVPLTDDVREVFDRMLAAEEDIARMERVNGYFEKLPDVITDNMSDATRARVEDYIEKARDKAVDLLTRKALRNYTKQRREDIKTIRAELLPQVEEEVGNRRVYQCGVDKNAVKRYRKLKDKETGRQAPERFINRAFRDPAKNDVANWAAALNPENWLAGLAEIRADYVQEAENLLKPALDALNSGMGKGVDIVPLNDGSGRGARVSNNAPWYREFYAEHKRKPNKAELREMARLMTSGDVNAPKVEGWTPQSAEDAEALRKSGEQLADIEKRIQAADTIQKKLAEVEQKYKAQKETGGTPLKEDEAAFVLQTDLTAEQYGYSSTDEMLKDVENSPTKRQAVTQRLDELINDLTDGEDRASYEESIREAIYNGDQALLIGVEQQLIEEYARKAKGSQEQAKISADIAAARRQQATNAAKADLAQMNVKDATRTNKFITAERKAAVKSAQLLAKKDFDGALVQKNMQAYWHAMAAESMKIKKRKAQYDKFLKAQQKAKPEAWLNDLHFGAVSKLFVRMGIAREIHQEAAANAEIQSLAAYAELMEQQFDCVDIAEWLFDENFDISDTNALTLEQYEDVVNAVKNIKAIVKAQKGVNMFSQKESFADLKTKMLGLLAELPTRFTPNPNKPTRANMMERWQAAMESTDTLFEMLDDSTYGFFSKVWGNAIKHASDREFDCLEKYNKADADALKKWLPDKAAEAAANEEIFYEELGASVTKHVLVKMLINLGNADNAQRLCETVPVGFEQSRLWIIPDESQALNRKEANAQRKEAAEMTRKNLVDFFSRVLTPEDVEYAQRKIDAAEMFWGEKNELEKRVKGFGLKKVEATPVLLDIGGKQIVMKGGYFPLMRNGETGSHAAAAEVADDDPLQGKRIRTYHTNTSATKARTKARYPVNLFPGSETQWIYESIHDLCWREVMNDFRRVMNDQELFATLKSKMGVARMNTFKELLEVSADPQNSKSFSEGERALGEAASWLRQRTSHAVIICNLKVVAQNYANALLYGNAVEGYTMADNIRALGRYMLDYHTPGKHREMVEFVKAKSAFMRERSELPDITVRDIVGENKEFAWEKVSREIGIQAMAFTDNATAMPNWLEAYNKKLNEGATDQEAIDFADTIVRRVLGSSRITDVASMQRGGPLMKLITMFQSFFNARWNEFLRTERVAAKQWTKGEKQKAFVTAFSYVVSKWLGQTMLAMALALQNPFGVDDKDKWPDLIKELKSYSFSMMGPVGQAGSYVIGKAFGMHEFDYRMSAVESTLEKIGRAASKVGSDKATTQDKVEGITDAAGLLIGVPSQFNRIFWNLFDAAFNDMELQGGDILRRRPKKDRK